MKIITICGSTKFKKEHLETIRKLTLEGNVVLSCPFYTQADGLTFSDDEILMLFDLHLKKIDMSDLVFVVNPNNYLGESTTKEIIYAIANNKPVTFLEQITLEQAFNIYDRIGHSLKDFLAMNKHLNKYQKDGSYLKTISLKGENK